MKSRIFYKLQNLKSVSKGGRGHRNPTRVLRVPSSALQEIDSLILLYRSKIAASPTSPRNAALKQFLDELEDILPPVPEQVEIPF